MSVASTDMLEDAPDAWARRKAGRQHPANHNGDRREERVEGDGADEGGDLHYLPPAPLRAPRCAEAL